MVGAMGDGPRAGLDRHDDLCKCVEDDRKCAAAEGVEQACLERMKKEINGSKKRKSVGETQASTRKAPFIGSELLAIGAAVTFAV